MHPDLHPMTYVILTHLATNGPMRGADLSDAFGMDKGGVSRQVQALVDLGLVERQPDPEDRRAILLDATAEGRKRLEVMSRHRSDRFDQRLGRLERRRAGRVRRPAGGVQLRPQRRLTRPPPG